MGIADEQSITLLNYLLKCTARKAFAKLLPLFIFLPLKKLFKQKFLVVMFVKKVFPRTR